MEVLPLTHGKELTCRISGFQKRRGTHTHRGGTSRKSLPVLPSTDSTAGSGGHR